MFSPESPGQYTIRSSKEEMKSGEESGEKYQSIRHNITMVLRFDSSPIDHKNRADVIKAVNRGVVFQKELDITDMVIQQMASSSASIMQNKN